MSDSADRSDDRTEPQAPIPPQPGEDPPPPLDQPESADDVEPHWPDPTVEETRGRPHEWEEK